MKDKILIITGASGIAAATIKLALQKMARVFYISKDAADCEQLKQALNGADTVNYMAGDLTDSLTAMKLVKLCKEHYGRIDALFNVAGISGRIFGDGPIHECTEEGWIKTMQTNVDTQYRMCREVIKVMLAQQPDENGLRGTVLNMSSILGIKPEPHYFSTVAYAASKGAILSMTKSMAAYYARYGIRINAIAPGLTATRMSERASADPEIIELMKHKQPLIGDVMQPGDIAKSAIFLLSSESKVITGETLLVDAGWSIA